MSEKYKGKYVDIYDYLVDKNYVDLTLDDMALFLHYLHGVLRPHNAACRMCGQNHFNTLKTYGRGAAEKLDTINGREWRFTDAALLEGIIIYNVFVHYADLSEAQVFELYNKGLLKSNLFERLPIINISL